MARLTAAQRRRLPRSAFGLPRKRAYPVENRRHAANAKARARQQYARGNLSRRELADVDRRADRVLYGRRRNPAGGMPGWLLPVLIGLGLYAYAKSHPAALTPPPDRPGVNLNPQGTAPAGTPTPVPVPAGTQLDPWPAPGVIAPPPPPTGTAAWGGHWVLSPGGPTGAEFVWYMGA